MMNNDDRAGFNRSNASDSWDAAFEGKDPEVIITPAQGHEPGFGPGYGTIPPAGGTYAGAPTGSSRTLLGDPHPGDNLLDRIFNAFRASGFTREAGWLGGLAAGMSRRFNVDVKWVRLAFVVAALFSLGGTVLLYGLGWLLFPDSKGTIHGQDFKHDKIGAGFLGGTAFALTGLVAVMWGKLFTIAFWVAALAGLAYFVSTRSAKRRRQAPGSDLRFPADR